MTVGISLGQSSDQAFPTPVTTNEISGTIRARDIGDPRLTTYFYAFNGEQGDIFINLVARNLTGDIDIFTADTLQPLAKIVVYPDAGTTETGRLVYLRAPKRLILRVEGRSPNDDPATFRIKFGGSFAALPPQQQDRSPSVAEDTGSLSDVKVNTVGTILPKESIKVSKKQPPAVTESSPSKKVEAAIPKKESDTTERTVETEAEGKTVYENKAAKVRVVPPPEPPVLFPPKRSSTENPMSRRSTRPTATAPPDPMANIYLVIEMKDGQSVEKPMSEVLRFSVDKGVLTVIDRDGKITRYSILDVSKVTIQ